MQGGRERKYNLSKRIAHRFWKEGLTKGCENKRKSGKKKIKVSQSCKQEGLSLKQKWGGTKAQLMYRVSGGINLLETKGLSSKKKGNTGGGESVLEQKRLSTSKMAQLNIPKKRKKGQMTSPSNKTIINAQKKHIFKPALAQRI